MIGRFFRPIVIHGGSIFGMVHAWVGKKRLKRDILRLFTMSLLENILGDYRLMTRNRKQLFKRLNTILTPPTKYSVKLVRCFSSV
jgi:hypothetical protein